MSIGNQLMRGVLGEIEAERERQDAKWGVQSHPNGTGSEDYKRRAEEMRVACEEAFRIGRGSWGNILLEEVFEAMAESSTTRLREELVQVVAVGVAWIEALDRERS